MKIPKLNFLLFLFFIGLLFYYLSKFRENLQIEYIELLDGIIRIYLIFSEVSFYFQIKNLIEIS